MNVVTPLDVLSADLLPVLRRVTGRPDLAFDGEPISLTGGFWAELASFRLAAAPDGWSGGLVARVMPAADTAAKETIFQREVAAQGYATPRVLAAGGPADGVGGRAFMLMPLAEGKPLLTGLNGLRALVRLPSLARGLPLVLATALADLHRLDPAPIEASLEDAGVLQPRLDTMLVSLRTTADATGRTDLADAASWLEAHQPEDGPTVICHGDLHPFNVLVDGDGAPTVLDWSAAMLASVNYDLGFTSLLLAEPPLVVPAILRPVVRAAARALSHRFLKAYERAAGVDIDAGALRWHQDLICLRALVEVAGWVAADTIDERGGHPWVIAGETFAARLTAATGITVTPR